MRDQARAWFVWLRQQTGADGFRFDAVKHFPAYVVEDLLYNAMGEGLEYFSVGEFVGGQAQLDTWVSDTQHRSGTFDFALREALVNLIEAGGLFDMGSLPNAQQHNRLKTVPFINNHDTWRGAFWDSEPGSQNHDDRRDDWRRNSAELAPTIDPDNARTDVAYAATFAVDGSPMVYYEDVFVNYGSDRFTADPQTLPVRDYLVNLIWAHQKLHFKDGAYKVRHQGSPDLLVIERSGKALIGLNDHGTDRLSVWVPTDFGARVPLHDYSGANQQDVETDANGWVQVSVPPMTYAIWGPVGISGGFMPLPRRTVQVFQFADDLGDARATAPGYGGSLRAEAFRTGGAIWVAANSVAKVWLYTDGEKSAELRVDKPDDTGAKRRDQGYYLAAGQTSNTTAIMLEFTAEREGYHVLSARLLTADDTPSQAYLKVEYAAPATSEKY